MQAVVEAALYDLTYQKFVDQKMFDAWFAKHHDREYLELAEEAARMARRIIDDEVGAAHKAHVETIQRLVEVLATSTRKDKWNDICGRSSSPRPTSRPSASTSPPTSSSRLRASS